MIISRLINLFDKNLPVVFAIPEANAIMPAFVESEPYKVLSCAIELENAASPPVLDEKPRSIIAIAPRTRREGTDNVLQSLEEFSIELGYH